MALKLLSQNKCFGGFQKVYSHESKVLGCSMKFGIFVPSAAEAEKRPVLYWLSGLTCTHENFIFKSGFQRYAAEHGFIVVNPDTSPRDCPMPGDSDSYDFGTGAGFYIDATTDPWKKHYKMESYVSGELYSLVNENFPVLADQQGIFGHSMGGHGALTLFFKHPTKFRSVSAFSPICNPSDCPWGQKAFNGYLGPDKTCWSAHDATTLAKKYSGAPVEILVDQGKEDNFLKDGQLLPERFVEASSSNSSISVMLRMQEGYDHSYYFISTFMGDHFKHHSRCLQA